MNYAVPRDASRAGRELVLSLDDTKAVAVFGRYRMKSTPALRLCSLQEFQK